MEVTVKQKLILILFAGVIAGKNSPLHNPSTFGLIEWHREENVALHFFFKTK